MSVARNCPAAALAPIVAVAAVVFGCGPDAADDDVYPRNCGADGPVTLFETEPGGWLSAERAGDYYVLAHSPDGVTVETWAVERCGRSQVRLASATDDAPPTQHIGVADDMILSCDATTGAMAVVDPSGLAGPRPLFPSVQGCRVVPVGGGFAAQQRDGAAVWFHPAPSDPEQDFVVVTDAARLANPRFNDCVGERFDCEDLALHPGHHIRSAGEDLLVAVDDGPLLAFSTLSLETRVLDPGPVESMDVLADGRHVVVEGDKTVVVDRESGSSFPFCCQAAPSRIRQLGQWVVYGSFGIPRIPTPPHWTNFRARHLVSGVQTEVSGVDNWRLRERLTADTVIADIDSWVDAGEPMRHVVWPATGERRVIDFPGDRTWTLPGRDGAYAVDSGDGESGDGTLRYLPGPDAQPRRVAQDVRVVFATLDGRIVLERARAFGEPTPLWVMLPDETIEEIEPQIDAAFDVFYWGSDWPVERDEVLYRVVVGDRLVVRRTVLP